MGLSSLCFVKIVKVVTLSPVIYRTIILMQNKTEDAYEKGLGDYEFIPDSEGRMLCDFEKASQKIFAAFFEFT